MKARDSVLLLGATLSVPEMRQPPATFIPVPPVVMTFF